MIKLRIASIAAPVIASMLLDTPVAQDCPTLAEQTKAKLVNYVQKRYKLPATAAVRIQEETVLTGCYRKLRFDSAAAKTAFSVSLYLSPDQRYLAPDLFDSHADPLAEERKANLAIQASLSRGDPASRGPKEASVTIIEFSDFQCPYCRRAAQFLGELMAGPEGKKVRLLFRHFPLEMHAWARAASEGAACAKFQSNEMFWKVHDSIFENQAAITADNVEAKLLEFVTSVPGADVTAYEDCLDQALSVGTIIKDTDAGLANKVQGTPTLFINGKRVGGIGSAAELQSLVRQAMDDDGETRGVTLGAEIR